MEDNFKENSDEDIKEEKNSLWGLFFKILKAFVALIVLVGLIYLSGIREYLFFQKTSPDLELYTLEQVTDLEEVKVPIKIILMRESSLGTERKQKEVASLIKNTQSIMNQAGISLARYKTIEKEISEEGISKVMDGEFSVIEDILNKEVVNIILLKKLEGLNGVAYPSEKIIIIPDYTAGSDFRTLAHELGHIQQLSTGFWPWKRIKMYFAPKYYEHDADLRGVDLMVKAGYNPIAMITLDNKLFHEKSAFYKFFLFFIELDSLFLSPADTHPSGSKRLEKIYYHIKTHYPQYTTKELDNMYYKNFLLNVEKNTDIKKIQEENKVKPAIFVEDL